MRLRFTAQPVFLLTEMPSLLKPKPFSAAYITNNELAALFPQEKTRLKSPLFLREIKGVLRTQNSSAFFAPSLQYFSAVRRSHAFAETMLATALSFFRLIRSFHFVTSFLQNANAIIAFQFVQSITLIDKAKEK
jgi:hypothetical protein